MLTALLPGVSSLRATTIFSNIGIGGSFSTGAGILVTNDSVANSSVAIEFTPAANYNLTGIEFAASDLFPDGSDAATIGIFADNAGQPDATPIESFSIGPFGQFGAAVPLLTATSVLQPLLLAGTAYWVGMNAGSGDFIVWNQNTSSSVGYSQTDGAGNWSTSPIDQGAVEIDGVLVAGDSPPVSFQTDSFVSSIPEPRSVLLAAGGLLAIAGLLWGGHLRPRGSPRTRFRSFGR